MFVEGRGVIDVEAVRDGDSRRGWIELPSMVTSRRSPVSLIDTSTTGKAVERKGAPTARAPSSRSAPDEPPALSNCLRVRLRTITGTVPAFQSETLMGPDRRRELWEDHLEHHRLEGLDPRAKGA
jgi:hypothetical protein